MFVIKNISKKYVSKNKKKVTALNKINLELPYKGFVCIIGRSGSGKSTLLNIMGALDNFEEGEVDIYGKSTKDFSKNDWDYYRGRNVGFIFQEYNLIEDLSVKENISLALEVLGYGKREIEKKIENILTSLDLKGFEDRMVYELSGGQRQRVAIARALVKEPKVILADEPTGNLDSETSKIILNYLKKFSKEKLVLMVTHDTDIAIKYADRIIELHDGQVINDSIKHNTNCNINNKDIMATEKCILPNNYVFKLAIKSLFLQKLKLCFMILIFTMSLILTFFSITISNFNKANITSHTLIENNIQEFNFQYQKDSNNCIDKNIKITENINFLQDKHSNLSIYEVIKTDISFNNIIGDFNLKKPSNNFTYKGLINNIVIYNKIDDNKLLYGNIGINETEIIITDYLADMLIIFGVYELNSIEQLIGQDFIYQYKDNTYSFKISGIIATDYKDYININSESRKEIKDIFLYKYLNNYSSLYFNNDNLNYMHNNTKSIKILFINEGIYIYTMSIFSNDIINNDTLLYGDSPSKNEEIVLPLSMIINIEGITYETFLNNEEEYLSKWINNKLLLNPSYSNDKPLENGYEVVGVIDNVKVNDNDYSQNTMYVYESYYNEYYDYYFNTITRKGKVFLSMSTIDNNKFLQDIENLNYKHSTPISSTLYQIFDIVGNIRNLLTIITLFIAFFAGLIFFTFISNSINQKKKDIGILRTLGLTGRDCSKAFILNSIMVTTFVLSITLFLSYILMNSLNNTIINNFNTIIVLFIFKYNIVLITIFFAVLITILATYIPVRKIAKMKPINAIKGK